MSKILELSAAMLPRATVPASADVQYFVKPTARGRNLDKILSDPFLWLSIF